jgi:hypothetical protein
MIILEIHQGKSKVYMNNIPATELENILVGEAKHHIVFHDSLTALTTLFHL